VTVNFLQGKTSNDGVGPQPAKLQPSSQAAAAFGPKWDEEELRRKQEELDRRAAELERREQAMQQNLQFTGDLNISISVTVKSCILTFAVRVLWQ
jgi:hypothetical protein